jgi:hypothetical protein
LRIISLEAAIRMIYNRILGGSRAAAVQEVRPATR